MKAEGRVKGDYLQWDYQLGSPEVERVFSLAMRVFGVRNFGEAGGSAIANRIMATRFDIEVVRHFHPRTFERAWLTKGQELSSTLALDSAKALEEIVSFVRRGGSGETQFVNEPVARSRSLEVDIAADMRELARTMAAALGRGRPLTELGDPMTPLQATQSHQIAV